MSFRSDLQPASFRGVPFHVSGADTAVGRRTVVHEFPLADSAQSEDLGRKASEFSVEGFIIGDDYLTDMRRLIGALTAPGPGTLVHPSMGTLQVVLAQSGGRLRESFIEKRGMVAFVLTFVDVGEAVQEAFAAVDTQQAVEDVADAAYDPVAADFASKFSIAGAPDWSVASIVGEIDRAGAVLADLRSGMGLDLSALSAVTRSAALFKFNLVTLLNKPSDLANALIGQVRALTDLFDFNPPRGLSSFAASKYTAAPLRAMLGLADYGQPGTANARPGVPLNGTPARAQQAANQDAVLGLIRRTAVLEAARTVVFQPFNSFDDAVVVRDTVYEAIETETLTAPDPVYRALAAVRVAVVADIAQRGLDLSRISTITLMDSLPAIVLSHRLYGSTAHAAELVERNNILNPLVIPGGVPLEVLSV